jgi:glycerol-3-phosphate dehydrogenase (NAD(P)+)
VLSALGTYLTPEHIVIHGTKGFDLATEEFEMDGEMTLKDIKTMSEVILEESQVLRVGALTGPNLADEILMGLPTATVVASEFDEVIKKGREALQGKNFFVFGSYDLKGAELAGALKNIIALASGIMHGHGLGKNVEAILITLGLREMMYIGSAIGANPKSFLGTAGIGDLIATATSDKSRNYSCGFRIAQGEKLQDIVDSMEEVAEGVRSLKVAYYMIHKYHLTAPLIKAIYNMVFDGSDVLGTINKLMKFPFRMDMDLS